MIRELLRVLPPGLRPAPFPAGIYGHMMPAPCAFRGMRPSSPCGSLKVVVMDELVAQQVEQRPFKAWVLGSSPSELTTAARSLDCYRFPSRISRIGLGCAYRRGQKCSSALARSRCAASSAVMSRCGIPSISNPTMYLRTVAERSSGG